MYRCNIQIVTIRFHTLRIKINHHLIFWGPQVHRHDDLHSMVYIQSLFNCLIIFYIFGLVSFANIQGISVTVVFMAINFSTTCKWRKYNTHNLITHRATENAFVFSSIIYGKTFKKDETLRRDSLTRMNRQKINKVVIKIHNFTLLETFGIFPFYRSLM